ncbi:MAG: VWA domain-containing protein, partial [Nitrospiraceae bacterium]|nr:VWA domain-containing protein [Nitrospiraceae bacterium]
TPVIGVIKPGEVRSEARKRSLALKKRLEEAISSLIELPDFEPDAPGRRRNLPFRPAEPGRTYLFIRGRLIELDGELLKELASEGENLLPGGVLVDGAAAGGRGVYRLGDFETPGDETQAPAGQKQKQKSVKYDEWDYRRAGYRRGWCTLYEQESGRGHEPFVEQTLKSYGGYVTALRNRFELLRREPKLLRRQKDGDDIDLDAMVEAIADMKAGIGPSDKDLFTRYERNERDIAALFLLDMSGSTKGWVNRAVKESVVLMCEALAALGDRYAIYGFSGMTRGRCDFYRIKSFGEDYGPEVKKRISGIEPKDYTRMGPAIRHSVSILGRVEARTRLLVVLSDGKPEDYDAYKGDYGIEDTRKALIEARQRGFHPFCITIDRQARSYMPHMYGASHYIVIDEVKKLPDRIPEIYRRLTA